MNKHITYVGLDVHKDTIAVAVAEPDGGEVRSLGTIRNEPEDVAKLVRKLGPAKRLRCCYEAGPCGYGVYRQLRELGAWCVVVAPSLIPTKPGDRVKTDRRDALKLARLLRSGDLTPVWVPSPNHEAFRDLTRAREAARKDLLRARHRLSKLLLRLSIRPPAGMKAWTSRHHAWLEGVKLPYPSQQVVFGEYRLAVQQAQERVKRLDQEVAVAAESSTQAPVIQAAQAMRGVGLVTAAGVLAELGDLARFKKPRQAMAYLGLTPSEDSSAGRIHRGHVTKTGNSHARYLVIEAAWHYRHPPKVSKQLKQRQAGLSEEVKAIAWKAQDRLHRRYRRMLARGKLKQRVIVAIARELVGFLWAIARAVARESAEPSPIEQVA